MGVDYFTDADDFCEEHPDVVILATSILSLEPVSAALQLLLPITLTSQLPEMCTCTCSA